MRIACLVGTLAAGTVAAATSSPTFLSYRRPALAAFASGGGGSGSSIPSDTVAKAESRVLTLAQRLNEDSKTGVFIADPTMKSDLKKAVAELEAVCGTPTERSRQLMLGDWTLLCTTNTPTGTADRSGGEKRRRLGPFKLPEPPYSPLQDKIRKSFEVTQRIRNVDDKDGKGVSGSSERSSDTVINRVDNIIEFTPFANTLEDILGEKSPLNAFKGLRLNPLEVSKSKLTLVHNAEVQSISPVLRTKISLKSVIFTVAGTSQYLEPDGADILGLNIPLGELLNAGSFDTTYVDERVRISRGTIGFLDELRVFVRKGIDTEIDESEEVAMISDKEEPEEEKTELQSSVEKLRDAVGGAVEDVLDAVEGDVKDVQKKVEGVRDAVEGIAKDVQSVVEEDLKEVRKSMDGVAEAVGDAAEDVAAVVSDDIKTIQSAAEDVADVVRGEVKEATSDAKESAERVTEAIEDAVEDVAAAISDDVEQVEKAAKGVTDAIRDEVEGKTSDAKEDETKKSTEAEDKGENKDDSKDGKKDGSEA